ncbi:MAG: YbfB/YjiJ family MFS transporter, partial [Rhodospirillaceae bacterium]|nr:YbfB/YjiJ family MFS transporter [Rhodospirillaceae bacterium]
YGPTHLGRIYGKMLTAWGAAGLSAPLVAGALYDWTGSYTLALLLAAGAAVVALAIIWSVPRRHS